MIKTAAEFDTFKLGSLVLIVIFTHTSCAFKFIGRWHSTARRFNDFLNHTVYLNEFESPPGLFLLHFTQSKSYTFSTPLAITDMDRPVPDLQSHRHVHTVTAPSHSTSARTRPERRLHPPLERVPHTHNIPAVLFVVHNVVPAQNFDRRGQGGVDFRAVRRGSDRVDAFVRG